MIPTTIVRPPDATLHSALKLAAATAAVRLALQFALTLWSVHLGYGYFRDEFYYLACGHHLAWGFVDHGPIVALQGRLGEILFGDSVFAIRILSAVAGALTVGLTGLLAWAMGGRRPAQFLAMLCVLLAPAFIGTDGYLSMNSWEAVFWMTCTLALLLMLRHGRSQAAWWAVFGISAGIGLLNKPSMAFFLASLGVGLLLTPERRILFTRWCALGVALMIALALPNVLWQIHNGWPTLEFLRNGQLEHKNVVLGPLAFMGAQLMQLHPATALVWVTGVVALLRARSIAHTRWLGLAYCIFLPLMWKLHAKDYYLLGFYPVLFAAGGLAWEHRYRNRRLVQQNRTFAFPVLEVILALLLIGVLPMAAPILKPEAWVSYTHALHLHGNNTENAATSILPQFFADRFGWEELTAKVTAAYRALPPDQQRITCISADNYGEAGALDFFNRRDHLGLPPALSRHNSYWMWGPHGCTAEQAILVSGGTRDEILRKFEDVTVVGHLDNPLIMPYEHKNIYLVRHRRPGQPFNWWNEHDYI